MQSPIKMNFRHPELENPALTHINRLPARSNLIPAQKSGVYFKNKEDSSLLQLLSGDLDSGIVRKTVLRIFTCPIMMTANGM